MQGQAASLCALGAGAISHKGQCELAELIHMQPGTGLLKNHCSAQARPTDNIYHPPQRSYPHKAPYLRAERCSTTSTYNSQPGRLEQAAGMAALPPAGPPGEAALNDLVRQNFQWSADFFKWWRGGGATRWVAEDRAGNRKPKYLNYSVPYYSEPRPAPDAMPKGIRKYESWLSKGQPGYIFGGGGADARNLQGVEAEVRGGEYGIMQTLRPLGFRLKKVLGKGGFGVACLFEMTGVDGKITTIVVKAATNRDAMTKERINSEFCPIFFVPEEGVSRLQPF